MNSASTSAAVFRSPTRFILPPPPSNSSNPNLSRIQYKRNKSNRRSNSTRSLQISHPKHVTPPDPPNFSNSLTVGEKLEILVSEFKSLTEPIDRVKRLIHYASLLPEFEESGRVESNRVTGCTAQVWLEVMMDVDGTMRFRVDSDSEITKGFCYCLIWLLDGATAGEVIGIRLDDLGEMNVGILPIRASSRVNTWHNVLLSMQRRTKALIMETYEYNHCFIGYLERGLFCMSMILL
ncbi:sufE-like protein 2, chloroplastic isoform X2 [Lactuca sativa]|uniref:sufE-like protein 2, chloroplastic isoform X2 n=1 Tax=Lactuca sativa TaxID=4236 RepID=UPI000CD8464F|nr:sufE-like protein 2, chloroplastic isoform X2 [Lactuca sativa]XP_042755997.1 sufE-like protein 2, chloroplastic isoform X2 [Lactuca sativa]XP_042755999.1 sufE-like protein 2, chloroplastic isoform X2 [Lactuca sativa]XP_042756000.1 sufE-like protein 2, chloroplastic isoform X2 [Lactuca sativa]XP_052625182.1 sufE-like protein 2, chloroplastic isoform X2 [Lactuca sativa]